ncbi:hypothetical protein LPJ53_006527 [Coemansia erecta]|uniref:Uncharacterized protein n=1 Tax=Coemansia erecta TaxID=147472 RepID=A0A9W7XPW6_9FUNG|nr:hypothetical protein LPJ53_006527 [Coemansia erecta]
MVGTSQPKSRLLIYDNRDRLEVGKPKLILEAKNCIIPSMDCSPAWDADTGLIFAPMRRYASGEANGIVNVWDPRYVKPGRTAQLRIPHDKDDILSVDIARSAAGSDPMMVTASKNGIAFTDLNCESI